MLESLKVWFLFSLVRTAVLVVSSELSPISLPTSTSLHPSVLSHETISHLAFIRLSTTPACLSPVHPSIRLPACALPKYLLLPVPVCEPSGVALPELTASSTALTVVKLVMRFSVYFLSKYLLGCLL
jgi:hypothetical protein